ncbi:YesL family protein [Salipaludibacillus neizhouensis]|nr:YesL family protein [Salipaludibacillus neizhouensis]
MNTSNPYAGIMRIAEWFVRFTYVNVLWFVFTLLGGVVFGFMPSTIAMFSLFRRWFRGEEEFPVFGTYWNEYKLNFKNSNVIGIPLLMIGIFLYVDFLILIEISNWMSNALLVILGMIGLVYLFVIVNIFPVLTHFKLSFKEYYKRAFYLSLLQPFRFFLLIITNAITVLLLFTIPILFPIIGASIFGAINMWSFLQGFGKIEEKKEHLQMESAVE